MIFRRTQLLSGAVAMVFLALALILGSTASVLADVYNCGTYGAGTYQNNVCGASTGGGGSNGSGSGGSGSGLVDTGQSIWLFLGAAALILAGTIMLYRTRKKMKARLAQNSR